MISILFIVSFIFTFKLQRLKPALLPHANTQRPDVIAYSPIAYITSVFSLCTSLTICFQIKKAHCRQELAVMSHNLQF